MVTLVNVCYQVEVIERPCGRVKVAKVSAEFLFTNVSRIVATMKRNGENMHGELI